MECVTDRQRYGLHAFGAEALDRFVDRGALAADHGLFVTVDVSDDEIAVDTREHALNVRQRREDSGHLAVVFHGHVRHFPTTCADRFECLGKRKDTCLHERRVFAEAVAHDHIGLYPVRVKQLRQCSIGSQHGRLRDLGLPECVVGSSDGLIVLGVDEDDVRQQVIVEMRTHHPVRLLEHGSYHGLAIAQFRQHVEIL